MTTPRNATLATLGVAVIAAVLVARRDRVWGREIERRAAGQARFNEATRARFGL